MSIKLSPRRVLSGVAAAGLAIGLAAAPAAAQYETVPRPAAYALEDVTVVHTDGRSEPGMTLVVRGEMIEALGRNVEVPADAELLEGESLVVYPGFVDGEGEADVDVPDPEIEHDEVEIWNAPRVLQGFTPAREVARYLTGDGDDVEGPRRAGIVAAAVHPDRGLMPGLSALLLYRPDAETPSELVLDPALGAAFAFRGAQGVYPATLFGVTAFIRQAFEDARYREQVRRAHARRPAGLRTPAYDADYEVLQDVLAGDLPVYFAAEEAADILRALDLAEEYGFRLIIVGGEEAWKVADTLRRRQVPVLVSTDFGEPTRWDPDEDTEAREEQEEPDVESDLLGEPEQEAEAEPLDAAVLREKQAFEDRWANAGRLAEAGVTFALTSGGSGELLEGVRKAVEYGLDEDAALRALTTTPAELLGVPHLVGLEPGLPANFVVTDGPLFDEKTKIRFTFVEGFKEEVEAERGAEAGSAEDAVSFGGTWDMVINAEGEELEAVVTIEQEGATFTGTMRMMGQVLDVRDGVINGNDISAVAVLRQGGETLEIDITGTVEGDEASGRAESPLGPARWTAERTGPGGGR